MPRYHHTAKAVEKATYAALPPASQQILGALAENGEAPVVVLVERKAVLAEATALVPITDAVEVSSEDFRRGGTHNRAGQRNFPPPPLQKARAGRMG